MPYPSKLAQSIALCLASQLPMLCILDLGAYAKTAKCYLAVNGKTYINGQCELENFNGDGSFSFNDGKTKTKCSIFDLGPGRCSNAAREVVSQGTFGQLVITSPGKGKIYWNEGRAIHAQTSIPPVTRNGACWEGKSVKLCAW